MLPFENLANENLFLLIAQIVVFAYFIGYFAVAVRRVYRSTWPVSVLKSVAVLFGYMILVSIAIESTSSFLIIAD